MAFITALRGLSESSESQETNTDLKLPVRVFLLLKQSWTDFFQILCDHVKSESNFKIYPFYNSAVY